MASASERSAPSAAVRLTCLPPSTSVCPGPAVFYSSFLRAFEGGERPSVSLDLVAKELKVERRRIYDIVNILEAVAVVGRSGKNMYRWSVAQAVHRRTAHWTTGYLDYHPHGPLDAVCCLSGTVLPC